MLVKLTEHIFELYGSSSPIPLHRPVFEGDEKQYLVDCIDSNFVSSVGERVTEFEERIARFVGARHAVATVNGTAALHAALVVAGVRPGDEVLTQALTFVATCNAVAYTGAQPVFVDVDTDTLGLSPEAARRFLAEETERAADGTRVNRTTGRRIAACLPMHTFGHPCRMEELVAVCDEYGIPVVEDAAESLGSWSGERHTGTFGRLGTLSFNGNKVITTGGGGMIVTDDDELAARARHLTTTAKAPHGYEFYHDELGYNYRMPNLNAALGCAQMDRLPDILAAKREVARRYEAFFADQPATFVKERAGTTANYWLNAIRVGSRDERDALLKATNDAGVMTRPIWQLMSHLPMYQHCQHDGLANSRWLEDRIVNLPSSVPAGWLHKTWV
ncbi:LegC family aminotransferase [Halorhodospira halochloris]|uniref:LegC family aminotransferase n=1 Tax=Halorhodospira halochloris TaxID=1052 RepID=UPI001EE99482|nr:LegC family aminotransferase [Halorhodospira halochloris]